MPKIIDLIGQRFGKLTVIEFLGRINKHSQYRCKCDCGGETSTTSNNLRRGHTKSCGCLSIATVIERSITHGLSGHPLYSIWCAMKNRCYYEGHNRHDLYVEKGVVVCEEWINNFKAFYDWAMANGWEKGLSIDRQNNNGIYSPDNCRMGTPLIQSRNRSSNIKFTYKGETRILSEWAEYLGVPYSRIQSRHKRGWLPDEIVNGKI